MLTDWLVVSYEFVVDDWLRDATSSDPRRALTAIRSLKDLVQEAEPQAVANARGAGMTWEEIGSILRSPRQAVHRKYKGLDTRGRLMTKLGDDVLEAMREGSVLADQEDAALLEPRHVFVALARRNEGAGKSVRLILDGAKTKAVLELAGKRSETEPLPKRRRRLRNSQELLASIREAMQLAAEDGTRVITERHMLAATLHSRTVEKALLELDVDASALRRGLLDQ